MQNVCKLNMLLLTAVLFACSDKQSVASDYDNCTETFAFKNERGGQWGLMDLDGQVLVSPRYNDPPTCIVNGCFSVLNEENDKYDIYRLEEKPRKIGSFCAVGSFVDGLCPVVDDDHLKFIDTEGKTALDLKKINGKKVMCVYNFTSDLAVVKLEDDKWGYINKEGKLAIPAVYADAWDFYDGVAVVYLDDPDEKNGKWGVINTKGELLFSKNFGELIPTIRLFDGFLICSSTEEVHVVLDKEGNEIIRMKPQQSISDSHHGYFTFYDEEKEKWGMMDKDGKLVVQDTYKMLHYNGKLLVATADDDSNYLLSLEGKELGRLPEGEVYLFDEDYNRNGKRIMLGNSENGYQLIDEEGNEVKAESEIYDYDCFLNKTTWIPIEEE